MDRNYIAAIDLGSNSFHMIIARPDGGHLLVVDKMREMVQLAAGLDAKGRISGEAQRRGLDCLARFGQRLRDLETSHVRILGTNTLRAARNGEKFVSEAEAVLGHSVEIISGIEEARLVYLGVAHTNALSDGQWLVVDIGGGSTEFIIGEGFEPLRLESLSMGCVGMTQRYFAEGLIDERRLCEAELAVQSKMESIQMAYREHGWQGVIGASGSIKAIRDAIVKEGWSTEDITLEGLRRLRDAVRDSETVAGIAERWSLEVPRAKVFTGGLVVLKGLCESLGIEQLQVSDGALREGTVYDLLGRIRHEDVRERTITTLINRYGLDVAHLQRVADTAHALLNHVASDWDLEGEDQARYLDWAARLHTIGLTFTHGGYHKHGAYVVKHSDLPGFSRSEQKKLATLISGHRRRLRKSLFKDLPTAEKRATRRLCILLRLAVLLRRSRSPQPLPPLTLEVKGNRHLSLCFDEAWLDLNPLTKADLEEEASLLADAGFQLEFA